MPPWLSNAQITKRLQTQWSEPENVGNTYTWTGKVLTYAIAEDVAPTDPSLGGAERAARFVDGFIDLTPMHARTALAFELWDDLIAIDLVEGATKSADIAIAYSKTMGADIQTFRSASHIAGDDYAFETARVWIGTDNPMMATPDQFDYGDKGFKTLIHEIGHTLGLSHPRSYPEGTREDDYPRLAEYAQDSNQYTVMSYFRPHFTGADHTGDFATRSFAATPLLHDIMAIQAKYGADYTTRATDTVYGFNCTADREVFDFTKNTRPVIAIWDGGGNDTLDAGRYTMNQIIDLQQGAFSSIGGLQKNVAIAYKCDIENAVGGAGNDTLVGNDLGNGLGGGSGDDELFGHGGNDTLYGSLGRDRLIGGTGTDTLMGGEDADRFMFRSLADSNVTARARDVIVDFEQGIDVIDLSAIDANTTAGAAVDQAFTSFVDRFTGVAGQLQWDQIGPNVFVVEADVNGDRNADFSLQITIVIGGGPALPGGVGAFSPAITAADFIL